jgi:hypothetical protein
METPERHEMRLHILDRITDPGNPDRPNDDKLCEADGLAAVFDGATGIGERLIFPDLGSDAAWLAALGADHFARSPSDWEPADFVRQVAQIARAAVSAATDLEALPRHAWPTCGFEMARLRDGFVELSGLGDCSALVSLPAGTVELHCPLPDARGAEVEAARRLLAASGGFGPHGGIVREGETRAAMRRGRDRHNTPQSGIWTLGIVEQAADHVSVARFEPQKGMRILLMSDGFSALSDTYLRHSPDAMIDIAGRDGLAHLLAELRHVERVEDPMAERHPRFKRCDDATAILAEITA